MWMKGLRGRELGRILRKDGIWVTCFVWAETALSWVRMEAGSKFWCVSEPHAPQASSSQPSLPWPRGRLAVGSDIKLWQGKRKNHLIVVTYPLLPLAGAQHLCPGAGIPTRLPMSFPSNSHSPTAASGLQQGPWRKQDAMFSSGVSSSCLSAVVSKADRNILHDLPSLACLKTMTLLPFMEEVAEEF